MRLVEKFEKDIAVGRVNWRDLLPEGEAPGIGHFPAGAGGLSVRIGPLQVYYDIQFQRCEGVDGGLHIRLVLRRRYIDWRRR